VSNVDNLILDLLEWLGPAPRPYAEVIEAWRTSCPRLPVWEEANDRGLIERQTVRGRGPAVTVSALGAEYLRKRRAQVQVVSHEEQTTSIAAHG
jgi:D-3-phosphoglycerate dehydrogenase / 2-oxoglutarate reductase